MTPETDHESAGQRALNLFVLQPAGWLATAMEDLPSLVIKGRECVSPHLRSAHAVGRMTVAFGAREMGRKANRLLHRSAESTEPWTSSTRPGPHTPTRHEEPAEVVPIGPTSASVAPSGAASPAPAETKAGETEAGQSEAGRTKAAASAPERKRPAAGRSTASRPSRPKASPTSAGKRATVDLAIPGYDTLSASQVVRRLDGLGEAELEAVRRYESGSRGRRTILNRIAQIRGEPRAQEESRPRGEPHRRGESRAQAEGPAPQERPVPDEPVAGDERVE